MKTSAKLEGIDRGLSGASAATEYYLAPEHLGEDNRSGRARARCGG